MEGGRTPTDSDSVTPEREIDLGNPGASLTSNQLALTEFILPTITLSLAQIQQLSPSALAYLGDAVYELYIRAHYALPPKRIQTYHHQVVAQVRAERQASHLQSLLPHLTDSELEVLKRGRNAASGCPKRVNLETYRQATSFEALVGHLYLTNPQRLLHLLSCIRLDA